MTFRWTNLGDLIDRSADLDQTALIDLRNPAAPTVLTHSQVDRLSNGVACKLLALGLKRGDHVAIAALNRAEYLIAYFGIMRAGLVAVPVNIKVPQETLDYVLADADVRLAFVDGERRPKLAGKVALIDFDDLGPDGFWTQVTPVDFTAVVPGAGEVAQMLYTSGSTGYPKGVRLSHDGQLWALSVTLGNTRATPEQLRYLVAQPLFHMNGLFMAKRAFATNSLLVVLPSFDVESYVDALERYRITTVTAVPTMFARIVKEPESLRNRDFSALQRVMLGSAPMTLNLHERLRAAFPHVQLSLGYGTTEASPAVFGPHPSGLPTPPLALGHARDDVGIVLEGNTMQPDDEGVLWIRNRAVMEGYNNLPEKTAQVLREGWYYTGDVMRRDADGFYYFVGRADDMFVCSGENIYPGEVEKTLESHPAVRQACVVPLADEDRGQVPVAFIVRRSGSQLDEAAVKQHALENGPAYQHPRRVCFLDELPWAGTNKVDRNALHKLAISLEAKASWAVELAELPA